MDKPMIRHPRLRVSRRTAGIGVAILLVVLGGVGVYHQYAWGKYSERAEVSYTETVSMTKATMSGGNLSAKDITEISHRLTTAADELCHTMPLLGDLRTQLIASAKEQQEGCEKSSAKLSRAAKAANSLTLRLDLEREVAAIYTHTQKELTEVKDGDYPARAKLWREAKNPLEDIQADQGYREYIEAQLLAVDDIIDRYDALIKADKDKKRPAFDAAAVQLQKAYDSLSAVPDELEAGYQRLAEEFVVAVEAL